MTGDPDGSTPEEFDGPAQDRDDRAAGRKLDEDAAWRAIVENYGPEPQLPPAEPDSAVVEPGSPVVEPLETGTDPLNTAASWSDEGHFVPPDPPPVPRPEPRRRLAWIGLFGAPLLMLLAVVLGLSLPDWVSLVLVGGFVGGFVYLVATMQRRGPWDGSGDDGAVV